jgi:hypothetical protein
MVTYAKPVQAKRSKSAVQKKKSDDRRLWDTRHTEETEHDTSVQFMMPDFLRPYVNDTP